MSTNKSSLPPTTNSSTEPVNRIGSRPLAVIESPFAAPTSAERKQNYDYGLRALRHSITCGEAPFAGHLLYTQTLDDLIPAERALGISLHIEFLFRADRVVFYKDLGLSPGMQEAYNIAERLNKPIIIRFIGATE